MTKAVWGPSNLSERLKYIIWNTTVTLDYLDTLFTLKTFYWYIK